MHTGAEEIKYKQENSIHTMVSSCVTKTSTADTQKELSLNLFYFFLRKNF